MHDLSGDGAPLARHVRVRGRVQGVFFRAAMRDVAERHEVAGWVRNRPDGQVEAWLEGPAPAVAAVLGFVRAGGPPDARVDEVVIDERPPAGHRGFAVLPDGDDPA